MSLEFRECNISQIARKDQFMLVVTIELFHFSVDNGHLRAAKNTVEAITEIFFDLFFI